jgi:hypothetical protein
MPTCGKIYIINLNVDGLMKYTISKGLICGVIAIAIASLITSPEVFATIEKNLMGSETSENAKAKGFPEGSMGDHSKAGGAAREPPFDSDGKKGRSGLANALPGDDPNHPSEVIAALCGDQGQKC